MATEAQEERTANHRAEEARQEDAPSASVNANKKRVSERQLTKDDDGDGGDDCGGSGGNSNVHTEGFEVAAEGVLAARKIVKVKRPGAEQQQPTSALASPFKTSPFAGFATQSSGDNPFLTSFQRKQDTTAATEAGKTTTTATTFAGAGAGAGDGNGNTQKQSEPGEEAGKAPNSDTHNEDTKTDDKIKDKPALSDISKSTGGFGSFKGFGNFGSNGGFGNGKSVTNGNGSTGFGGFTFKNSFGQLAERGSGAFSLGDGAKGHTNDSTVASFSQNPIMFGAGGTNATSNTASGNLHKDDNGDANGFISRAGECEPAAPKLELQSVKTGEEDERTLFFYTDAKLFEYNDVKGK